MCTQKLGYSLRDMKKGQSDLVSDGVYYSLFWGVNGKLGHANWRAPNSYQSLSENLLRFFAAREPHFSTGILALETDSRA